MDSNNGNCFEIRDSLIQTGIEFKSTDYEDCIVVGIGSQSCPVCALDGTKPGLLALKASILYNARLLVETSPLALEETSELVDYAIIKVSTSRLITKSISAFEIGGAEKLKTLIASHDDWIDGNSILLAIKYGTNFELVVDCYWTDLRYYFRVTENGLIGLISTEQLPA